MWPFKSPKDNHREQKEALPGVSEDVSEGFKDLLEMLQQHTADIATLNTAVNRVERKQNRWLEILNVRETEPRQPFPSPTDEPAAPLAAGSPNSEAGVETE